MRFMQTESVLQTKNRSEEAKHQFSVALLTSIWPFQVVIFKCCKKKIFFVKCLSQNNT